MQRWRSEPLPLGVDVAATTRIDLEFAGVRRNEGSFTLLVFINAQEDLPASAGREHPSFAAGYSVFAQAGCWGDAGHCDWERGPVHEFDVRPPHHLQPFTLVLEVTDAVRALGNPDALTLDVHAARTADPDARDVFRFESVTALAYQ
jgi:hypothetical protein